MSSRLAGKVALVTGAASGIGAGIANMYVSEGASVIAADVDADRLATAVPGAAMNLLVDVREEAAWLQAAQELTAKFGQLHVLVNNAGIGKVAPLEDATLSDWQLMNGVNVQGAFLGTKALLPLLKAAARSSSGGASVINMSSVAGILGFAGQSAYGVTKAAVAHLSRCLAVEFMQLGYNIRVNSIHPGPVLTPALERSIANSPGGPDVARAAIAKMTPGKPISQPQDIAFGAVYLASDESNYVNGSQLVIDGGLSAAAGR